MVLRLVFGLFVILRSATAIAAELTAASDDFSDQYADERVDVDGQYWAPADSSVNDESEADFSQRGNGDDLELVDAG